MLFNQKRLSIIVCFSTLCLSYAHAYEENIPKGYELVHYKPVPMPCSPHVCGIKFFEPHYRPHYIHFDSNFDPNNLRLSPNVQSNWASYVANLAECGIGVGPVG